MNTFSGAFLEVPFSIEEIPGDKISIEQYTVRDSSGKSFFVGTCEFGKSFARTEQQAFFLLSELICGELGIPLLSKP
jgi:hypothetical protein